MGLFSSIGKVAGAIAPLIPDSSISAAVSGLGQMWTNQQQINLANTSYQRQVADMKKAGINPIMSVYKANGAAVPDIQNPAFGAMSTKTAARQLSLNERDVESRIALNNSTAEKQRAEQKLLEQQAITEESKRQYMAAQSLLTQNQAEKVAFETREILPLMREKIQAQIDKIGDERERIRVQKALDEASIFQIYEMTYVAKAQLEINRDNAVSQRISANATATSSSAAMKDAKGRENAGYYEAQAGKNITAALGDLAQVIGFVVSKGRF